MLDAKNTRRTVVGIDLAGSPKRNTGICALRGLSVTRSATVYADEAILRFIDDIHPDLIAVDAPLNLPPGRRSLDDRNAEHFRPCDRELLKRGIRFFPITLGPMRSLTERGIRLKKIIEARGYDVIEIYPGAAQDILGIPRKQGGLPRLRRGLARLGIKGMEPNMNGDELDAVTGAFVGRLYLKGQAEVLGNFEEGAIVVPRTSKKRRPGRR